MTQVHQNSWGKISPLYGSIQRGTHRKQKLAGSGVPAHLPGWRVKKWPTDVTGTFWKQVCAFLQPTPPKVQVLLKQTMVTAATRHTQHHFQLFKYWSQPFNINDGIKIIATLWIPSHHPYLISWLYHWTCHHSVDINYSPTAECIHWLCVTLSSLENIQTAGCDLAPLKISKCMFLSEQGIKVPVTANGHLGKAQFSCLNAGIWVSKPGPKSCLLWKRR